MRVLGIVVAVLVILVAGFLAAEAVYIGAIAGEGEVAKYHFGSDSMMGHGGQAYRSKSAYLMYGVVEGGIGMVAGCGLLFWLRRKSAAA